MPRIRLTAAALMLIALPLAAQQIPSEVRRSLDAIRADAIRAHVKFLSSDLLEGRGPGTRGDALATQYIASQLEANGVAPGGDNGTYFQKVSLLGIETDASKSSLAFTKGGASIGMKWLDEFVGGSQTQKTSDTIDSEVVFVGHGVTAPEYKWDDFKGFDARGKTLVMLVNDPPATEAEPDLFRGRARTYYGRWTYKLEQGIAKNADAVILIHTNDAAGYGWNVVRNSWSGENSFVRLQPGEHSLRFAGWISESKAKELFAAAGHDLDAMTKAAGSRSFKPVPLGQRLKGNLTSKIREFTTNNVIGKIEGADPVLKNEAVLYSAHHDHLGIGTPDAEGDAIYNGAIDNATGIGALIELARVWAQTQPRPKRSIVFAAVAAEEQGLLGSEYFGQNPNVPAGRITLGINMDALYLFGRVGSVTMIGVDRTSFWPTAQRVTSGLNLKVVPDQSPEQGLYYRSDHFSLAKAGVPAFSIKQGNDIIGADAEEGRRRATLYRDKQYHQPSDEFDPTWNFDSAKQVDELAFWLGYEAANAKELVNWMEGEEFRAVRDSALSAAGSASPQPRPRLEKQR